MTKPTLKEKIAELKILAIAVAEIAYHYKIIANSIGYSEDQLKKWRDEDTDFADSIEQARSRFLTKQIRKSKPEFLLERLEPSIFKLRSETDLTSLGERIEMSPVVISEVKARNVTAKDQTTTSS